MAGVQVKALTKGAAMESMAVLSQDGHQDERDALCCQRSGKTRSKECGLRARAKANFISYFE